MIAGLVEQFATLEDPRCPGKIEHRLVDILVIAVCAIVAEAECLSGDILSDVRGL